MASKRMEQHAGRISICGQCPSSFLESFAPPARLTEADAPNSEVTENKRAESKQAETGRAAPKRPKPFEKYDDPEDLSAFPKWDEEPVVLCDGDEVDYGSYRTYKI